MLTALISSIIGLVSGILPDVFKEFTASRQAQREADFLRLQNELAIARAKSDAEEKLRESHEASLIADANAFKETLSELIKVQSAPTNIPWIDGLNAVIRPVVTLLVIALFVATAGMYVKAVIVDFNSGHIKDSAQLSQAIWGSMIGESITAVLGFVFGYRSTAVKR